MRCLRWLRYWSPLVWPFFLLTIPACISSESAKQRESSAHIARTLGIYDTHIKLDAIQELIILGFTTAVAIQDRTETATREARYKVAYNAYQEKVDGVDDISAKIAVLLQVAEVIHECGWNWPEDEHLSCNKELMASLFGRSILPAFYGLRHAFYCDGVIAERYFRDGNENSQVYKLETILLEHLNSKSSASGNRDFVRALDDKTNVMQNSIRPDLVRFCDPM